MRIETLKDYILFWLNSARTLGKVRRTSELLTWVFGLCVAIIAFLGSNFVTAVLGICATISALLTIVANKQLDNLNAPRTIDTNRKQLILDALANIAPCRVIISAAIGDCEAINLAEELAKVFKDTGWQVEGPDYSPLSSDDQGIILRAHDQHSAHKEVSALKEALATCGFEVRMEFDERIPNKAIDLLIGYKGFR